MKATLSPLLRSPFRHHLATAATAVDSAQCAPKLFSKMPSGPKGLPLVGNVPMILDSMKRSKKGEELWTCKLQSKYGPIFRMKLFGSNWAVCTSSPVDAETVFRSEGNYPSRGHFEDNVAWIYKKLKFPTAMSFSNGEEWKSIRSKGSKQMAPRRVGNFVEPLCDIAEELLSHLETIQDEAGNVPDITPEMNKWAFQGVSYLVYGEKIPVYSGAGASQKEFMEAGLDLTRSVQIIINALPLYRIFPTKPFREYKRVLQRMHRAGQVLLEKRYEEIEDSIASGEVDETKAVGLLDQWLIEGELTEQEALAHSFDMLSGGIDTTSSTASFLLYELAKQPEIQERLVQEISSAVGDKRHPSWDDLQRMSLVRNCVKESMRMHNLGNSRIIQKDAVLQGYQVPAGTFVVMVSMASEDEQLFEAPKEFRPDRWERGDSEKIHPFSSLPFGFGPKGCYGRRLAELELFILLAKLLPKYQLATSVKEMKVKLETLLTPNLPLHINFRKRT